MRGANRLQPQPPRRAVLRAALATAAYAALAPTLAACTSSPAAAQLSVAGGEHGGFYLEFAALLARSLERYGVAAHAEALTTGGTLDNIDRLRAGTATLGMALSDAAVEVAATDPTAPPSERIVALGKVYENYLHVVVRRDSRVRNLIDLGGHRVSIGGPRSGTAVTANHLLATAGLDVQAGAMTEGRVTTVMLGLNESIAALRSGTIDAFFWSGGLPTAALVAVDDQLPLRLLDVSELIAPARARYGPYYEKVLIPDGTYRGIPATWTVGVADLLLCRADLPDDVAHDTVQLLLAHPGELVPQASRGLQFLSAETLINTARIPLHPGAAAAYRDHHG